MIEEQAVQPVAEGEYAECLLKARYYEVARRPLDLIETLKYSPGEGFVRTDLHLARMARSAVAAWVVEMEPAPDCMA